MKAGTGSKVNKTMYSKVNDSKSARSKENRTKRETPGTSIATNTPSFCTGRPRAARADMVTDNNQHMLLSERDTCQFGNFFTSLQPTNGPLCQQPTT